MGRVPLLRSLLTKLYFIAGQHPSHARPSNPPVRFPKELTPCAGRRRYRYLCFFQCSSYQILIIVILPKSPDLIDNT